MDIVGRTVKTANSFGDPDLAAQGAIESTTTNNMEVGKAELLRTFGHGSLERKPMNIMLAHGLSNLYGNPQWR